MHRGDLTRLGFVLVLAVCAACAPAAVPPSATPPPTVTPAPGLGVPVVGRAWTVTLLDVRAERQLGDYAPKADYAFLVVELKLEALTTGEAIVLATDMVTLLDPDGRRLTADGTQGSDGRWCVGCLSYDAFPEGQPVIKAYVFVVPQAALRVDYRLQFQDEPVIPFTLP